MEHTGIAERMKKRRMELDMSVADLANRLSMSKATIHRYESGEIKHIKMPVIASISNELKVDPAWLLGKTDNKELIDYESAIEKYSELSALFDDLVSFIGYRPNIKYCGNVLEERDREALADGLNLLRRVILDRYR